MSEIVVTTRTADRHVIPAQSGVSVMRLIKDAGIDELNAACGGFCSCATCHIYVDPEFSNSVPPIGSDENDLLEGATHRTEFSRLACQIVYLPSMNGLRVVIAPEG